MLEEDPDGRRVVAGDGAVERRRRPEREGPLLGVRAALQEQDGGGRVVEEDGQAERGHPVVRADAHESRVCVEERAQPVDVPDRGRIPEVQFGIRGEQVVDDLDEAAVARESHGRQAFEVSGSGGLGVRRDDRSHPLDVLRLDRIEDSCRGAASRHRSWSSASGLPVR